VAAILKADLKKVKALQEEGALLTEPDNNQMYPLVAAAYSTDIEMLRYLDEQLGQRAEQYWQKVDINEVEKRVQAQIPEKRPEWATEAWFGEWYGKHAQCTWCHLYDDGCLKAEEWEEWSTRDWNERRRKLKKQNEGIKKLTQPLTKLFIFESESEKEYKPSEKTHDEIVSKIIESLFKFNDYVREKVSKFNTKVNVKLNF
jgi:hypothetical protein